MKRLLLCVFLFLFGTLACQPRLLWWKQKHDAYQSVLQRWTQKGELYQGLKTVLSASATYLHPDTRSAYVRQYSNDHHFSEQEEKELLSQEEAKAKSQLEFIVTTFSDDDDWWRLDGESPIWAVYLSNDKGIRVKPKTIEYLENVPIYIKTYYPLITPWKRVYRLTFPLKVKNTPLLDEQTRHFSLEFLSAVAQLKLNWKLK